MAYFNLKKAFRYGAYTIPGLLLIVSTILFINKNSSVTSLKANNHVDTVLLNGDLKCGVATNKTGAGRSAAPLFVDGLGGYSTHEKALQYFVRELPGMPANELKLTQVNSDFARYEINNKAVFLLQKNEEGLWQPYVRHLCPNLGWGQ